MVVNDIDDDDWQGHVAAGAALLNEAIRYASQVAAIGTNGLMDTFLPPDVPRAAPFDAPPAEPREWTEPTDGTVIT
jgi:hypothetical protein